MTHTVMYYPIFNAYYPIFTAPYLIKVMECEHVYRGDCLDVYSKETGKSIGANHGSIDLSTLTKIGGGDGESKN